MPLVEAHLSPALLGRRGVEIIRALAPLLPADALTALELRLAPGAPATADVAVRLTEPRHGRTLAPYVLPPLVQRLLTTSADAGRLPEGTHSLWLELDLGEEAPSPPFPAVLIAEVQRGINPGSILDDLLPVLCGRAPKAARRALIQRCLSLLPPAARLLYLFNLEARGSDAVRLEITHTQPEPLLAYLERLVPAEVSRPLRRVAPFFQGAERFHLSFDLAAEILPRVGLEASFIRLPHREPGWARLFDRLVAAGLCSEEKGRAALAWPGQDTFWSEPALWPLEGVGVRGALARGLSHVKLVTRPHREPEAKVYLVCQYLRRPAPPAGEEEPHHG